MAKMEKHVNLDGCNNLDDVKRLLEKKYPKIEDRLHCLFEHMGVKNVAYSGGVEGELATQYDIALDVFQAGNWRVLSGV